ncbi:MAG: hypothetical protein ACRECT_07735 [Thermoplasmata archaeon]
MANPTPPPASPPVRARGLTKSQKIGGGLLLTFVGLFLISALIPTAPDRLAYALGVAGAGVLSIWVGGILMGIGSRS